ncbi:MULTISPECIES: thermonuclease family protein [unclassified Sphingobium]|uniref:thermonuclease family protein n=1 Tax=unclassified Sphingobium TaxID=2611147 RepID=UPI0022247562|nr:MULTISPECIES: thermonuclease family protein [unclassified Sphingobium]MCW2395416.1 endonuclease YncB(thermonuclease family) [Sphingobium sp. B8D3B]MCW2418931.1 endonuclease YncB(thermonuclease family) [Sphingobium sp. B8D3C]
MLALLRAPPERIEAADGARVHVMDGDSLRIGPRIVRIADIDAVELNQRCQDAAGQPWDCGTQARDALLALVRGGGLTCESRTTDQYGRAVATCATPRIADVGATMVAEGWAISDLGRGSGAYRQEEEAARSARRGIWRGTFETPSVWRAAHPRS